jgi:hypothetical protein
MLLLERLTIITGGLQIRTMGCHIKVSKPALFLK